MGQHISFLARWARLTAASVVLVAAIAACPAQAASVLVAADASPTAETLAAQGDALTQAGEYHTAIRNYKEAIRLSPSSSTYADGLGLAYERVAETSAFPARPARKARLQFERALQLNPENISALRHLIALSTDPVGLCAGNTTQTEALLARLSLLDPQAGSEETRRWQQRLQHARTPEERLACSPVSLGRALQKLLPEPSSSGETALRPAALRSTTH